MNIFIACFFSVIPFLVGTLRTDWWVWPCLITNIIAQFTIGAIRTIHTLNRHQYE